MHTTRRRSKDLCSKDLCSEGKCTLRPISEQRVICDEHAKVFIMRAGNLYEVAA